MSEQNKTDNLKAGQFYGKISRKQSISSCVLSEVAHLKPTALPAHSHELGFFMLLLDGDYSEIYGRKSFSYNPLTISWHRPGITHKDAVGGHGARCFMVEVNAISLERLREIAREPEDFHAQNSRLVWLALRLYQEFKDWHPLSPLAAEGVVLEMLAAAAHEKSFGENQTPPLWLRRVVERLNEEFTENFTTEDLAAEARVHPVHLAAAFRRFYGGTISDYIQKQRVSLAAKLLLNREVMLSDIAFQAGFADQSHFTRVFKRLTGQTPGAFRLKIAGDRKQAPKFL